MTRSVGWLCGPLIGCRVASASRFRNALEILSDQLGASVYNIRKDLGSESPSRYVSGSSERV